MSGGARPPWQAVAALAGLLLAALFRVGPGLPSYLALGPAAWATLGLAGAAAAAATLAPASPASLGLVLIAAHATGFVALSLLGEVAGAGTELSATLGFWGLAAAAWFLAWLAVSSLSALHPRGRAARTALGLAVPALFGLWLLYLWEVGVRALGVPPVLLPAPSQIAVRLVTSAPTLAADFQQTVLKAVAAGWVIGCGAGFLAALLADRVPFLRRGLLPIGNLVSALPIVGIAPILVMWFGFDWESKAAVVVVMTFFPMLVNTVAGLAAADRIERDLMRTYAATPAQALLKLRLPAALPFIFNALKINSTLALIGAIVAEFFGTPIVGMGFRISTAVGRMEIDLVWAEIAVAALAGSAAYGGLALLERRATFWHPSFRS